MAMTLRGANGSDALNGGSGRDTIDGAADTDNVDGGSGRDVCTNVEIAPAASYVRSPAASSVSPSKPSERRAPLRVRWSSWRTMRPLRSHKHR